MSATGFRASSKALRIFKSAALCGISAVSFGASSAWADTVAFGGGTISVSAPGTPINSVDANNNVVLVPSGYVGCCLEVMHFTIDSVTAGKISVAGSSSFTLAVHGSNLTGIISEANGGTVVDTTGGAPNTIKGGISIYMDTSPSKAETGDLTISTGADTISAASDAISAGHWSHYGDGQVNIDSVGATITSTGGSGIVASSFYSTNPVTAIMIGGLNGGIASTIIAPNGWGIIAYGNAGGPRLPAPTTVTSPWPATVTLAALGNITAKGGISAAIVDTFGTIIASSNPAINGNSVTLESGSVTEGTINAQSLTIKPGAVWVTGTTQSLAGIVTSGGVLSFNQTSTVTFTGSIQAAGGLSDVGSGALILTGNSPFAGPTFIAQGSTLQFGNGGTSGSLAGNIADNGTLVFNRSDSVTFAGTISGTGALTQAGTGTLILSGTNTYTGGTTVNGGWLSIGSDTNIGAGPLALNNGTGIILTGTSYSHGVTVTGDPTFSVASGSTATWSGVIGGSGEVVVTGGGTLKLTATNTYAGLTQIASSTTLALSGTGSITISSGVTDNGTFDISATNSGASITSLSGGGIVNLGAQTLTLTNASANFSGAINGTGGMAITGGSETLTGTNSYTGGTTVSAGSRLQIGNGGTTGSLAGAITDNGALIFNRSDAYTFGGTVSGTGAVQQTGTGTTVLTGSNTYSGGTTVLAGKLVLAGPTTYSNLTITGGTLQVGNGGTLGGVTGPISDNGALVFNRSDTYTYTGVISGSGTVAQIGGGTLVLTGANTYTGGTIISAGTLQIGNGGTSGSIVGNVANNGLLVFNRSDTVVFSGQISGSGGLSQTGSGLLILNGANSVTGTTTVASGTLEIGDASHPSAFVGGNVVVASGATLQGHGTVLGAVVNTSGGTVAPGGSVGTLTVGSYTQGPTSTLSIAVTPTAASRLQVVGQASLNGTLALAFDAGTYGTHAYQIIGAGSLSGAFSTVSVTNAPAASLYGIGYSPTSATLVVEPVQSGQIYSDLIDDTFDAAETFNNAVFNHLGSRYCNGAASSNDRREDMECPKFEAWLHSFGGTGSHDGGDGADNFNNHFIGAVGGFDIETELGLSLGLTAFYSRSTVAVSGNNAGATTDSYGLAANGSFAALSGRVDTNAYWLANNSQAHRLVTPDGQTPIPATAQPKSNAYGGAIQYSRPIITDDLTALGRVLYSGVNQSAFSENGAGPFNLAVSSKVYSAISGDAGLRVSHVYHIAYDAAIIPEISMGARADLTNQTRGAIETLEASSATSFDLPAAKTDRVSFIASAGVTIRRRDGALLYLRGDSQMGAHEKAVAITLGGRIGF